MTRKNIRPPSGLDCNDRGATLVEFALILPVFLMLLMGIGDIGMQFYAKQVLQGVVSQAARNSTLETFVGNQTALDEQVETAVKVIFRDARVQFSRRSYQEFGQVGKPEDILNDNGNGVIDRGECFLDVNGTGQWEADRGRAGNGGSDDVVRYIVRMEFDRMFPLWAMLGQPQSTALSASTTLRNQPFGSNAHVETEICLPR